LILVIVAVKRTDTNLALSVTTFNQIFVLGEIHVGIFRARYVRCDYAFWDSLVLVEVVWSFLDWHL